MHGGMPDEAEVEVVGGGYSEWKPRAGGGFIIVPLPVDCCSAAGPDRGRVYAAAPARS